MTAVPEFITYEPHRQILETGQYVVILDRYLGSKEFGIHVIDERPMDELWMGKYRQYTIGLLDIARTAQLGAYLQFGRNLSMHTLGEVPEDLIDYIGAQVIPLEWKKGWRDGDAEILDRVEVYS